MGMPMSEDKLLILSLDSLSEKDLDLLLGMKHFGSLLPEGTLVREVDSIFLTNTYPVHTSVITGCHPNRHGILDNPVYDPGNRKPDWNWYRKKIGTTTLYDEARRKRLKAASVLWPVTAGARIRYHIPEIFPKKRFQNQFCLSFRNGSVVTQAAALCRYGHLLDGRRQPNLDDFSTMVMADLIRRKKPDLALLHLIDVDSFKHKKGTTDNGTYAAVRRMDGRLGLLLEAIRDSGEAYSLIFFSDHGGRPVDRTIDPNDYLVKMGIKVPTEEDKRDWEAWFRPCGGSAILYLNTRDNRMNDRIMKQVEELVEMKTEGIGRLLSKEEMDLSGFGAEAFLGIEAAPGMEFKNNGSHFKANHGYGAGGEDYKVFYFAMGSGIVKGSQQRGGSLLEIAPLACRVLGLDPWEMDGRLRPGLFIE